MRVYPLTTADVLPRTAAHARLGPERSCVDVGTWVVPTQRWAADLCPPDQQGGPERGRRHREGACACGSGMIMVASVPIFGATRRSIQALFQIALC